MILIWLPSHCARRTIQIEASVMYGSCALLLLGDKEARYGEGRRVVVPTSLDEIKSGAEC